jgi:UDP-GlcNAc:undecaprenyl-phosphate GlcNAc-1-phosphate transferase
MTPYLLVGLVAFAGTFVVTPAVVWLTRKVGAIDHPSDRKVHAHPTPTIGGSAMLVGMFVAGAAAYTMADFETVFSTSSQVWGTAVAAVVIFLLGVVDDLRNLPAPVKLAGQIFASGILFLTGVKMQFILLPTQTISIGDDVSVLITVFWLVAMMNAVNLVDGLDGLAAGIVAIAASAFFVYTYESPILFAEAAPLMAIIIVGATLGFLRYNFHPARIFMGDSGSMLLGLVLGATTIAGIGNAGTVLSTSDVFLAYFPLVIPLLVLAIPIADALLAIVRRARKRRSVFHADKEHLHHRLMDLGHGHRQAVLVMYVWSALAAGAGLAFAFLDSDGVILALPVAVGAIVLYTLFPVLTKALQSRL